MDMSDFLSDTNQTLTLLNNVLKDERKFLEQNELEALNDILDKKHDLITQVKSAQSTLFSVFKSKQIEPSKEGFKALVAQSDANPDKLIANWETFVTLLSECEELNQINGALIVASKNQNGALLDLMLGREKSQTYNQNAQTSDHTNTYTNRRV